MIAAFRVGRDVCDEFVACALRASTSFDDTVVGGAATGSVIACGSFDGVEEGCAHVGDETWKRPGSAGDVKDRFVLKRVTAHHVHVNVGAEFFFDLRMGCEEGHGAFDFWSPHETQSALRLRQSTGLDEVRENTGGF